MATLYTIGSKDGEIRAYNTTNWATSRDASSGTVRINDTLSASAISAYKLPGRGGGSSWQVKRAFFNFDTSGISDTLSSATLKLYGRSSSGSADFFVLASTQHQPLEGGDFGSRINGWTTGDNTSNVTYYSDEITSWSTSGYNDITLNATALAAIKNDDDFTFCLVEADYDLTDTEPSLGTYYNTGLYWSDNTGTSKDPYIDYTVATTDNAVFFGSNF